MKQLLITIAALVLVGCGKSQHSTPEPELNAVEPITEEANQETPKTKASDLSIHDAAYVGNIEAVKQHLAAGADVNAKIEKGNFKGMTPLDWMDINGVVDPKTADLLRKHGGKTGEELKAEGK